MRKAASFGLEIDVLIVRKPTESTSSKSPTYAGPAYPSFVALAIQGFQFSTCKINLGYPTVFVVEGSDLYDCPFSIRRKKLGLKA